MIETKQNGMETLKQALLDKDKYEKIVKLISYGALFLVAVVMTVLNIVKIGFSFEIKKEYLLTYTTGVFALLIIPNFIVTLLSKRGGKICAGLFAIELIAMFLVFLYDGTPEGFSALWVALLPIASMIFFGRVGGSIISGFMLIVLVLAFYTPLGAMSGMYDGYTETFKVRFPILYVAFFAIAFLLESIQTFQFSTLKNVNKLNEQYSTHDQLTGLLNRKGFYDLLQKQLKSRSYSKIGFIIFDLDYFKKLNDIYGHLAGDEVLIEAANIIREKLSKAMAACRWGGEEFLVCYVDDQIKKADLEYFRSEIERHDFMFNGKKMKITISAGVFETNDKDFENHDDWLKNADIALYHAKESGRNRIIYY